MSQSYLADTVLPSLQDAWSMFVQERSISLSPTTICSDYQQVTKWLARCPITDLMQGRQVVLWVLSQEPVQSARRVTMFVRSMYRWAASDDVAMIPRNPVANFKLPKPPQRNHEIITIPREEIPVLMNCLKTVDGGSPDWSLFAEWMLQTGMRTGEVRALKWHDIDGDRARVHANYTLTHGLKASTKTNKARWVPINAKAKDVLKQLDATEEFLFPWNRSTFQKAFRLRVDRLHSQGKLSGRYRPYDLRHVAISRWLEAGIPVAQAAQWAGNTSDVIWRHYANTTTEYEMPVL